VLHIYFTAGLFLLGSDIIHPSKDSCIQDTLSSPPHHTTTSKNQRPGMHLQLATCPTTAVFSSSPRNSCLPMYIEGMH
jgi:hypothetical protein